MKETYFGFNKVVIKFQDWVIIYYLLFKVNENKYYVLYLILMILNKLKKYLMSKITR